MQYKIIGADKEEYGPVDEKKMREWIRLSRAYEKTQCRREGESEWRNLEEFEEFKDCFSKSEKLVSAEPPASGPPPQKIEDPGRKWSYEELRDQLLARDVNFSIGACCSRGWDLAGKRFGLLLGASLVMMLMLGAANMVYLGFIIQGPLLGGLYWIYLMVLRDQETSLDDLFSGFRHSFAGLLLVTLIVIGLTLACMIPGGMVFIFGIITGVASELQDGGETLMVILFIVAFCVFMIPLFFLSFMTFFAYPIVMEYRLGPWDAVKLSFVVCKKRWLEVGVLFFLAGLVACLGLIILCIGIIFTMVWFYAIMIVAYEDLFGNAE